MDFHFTPFLISFFVYDSDEWEYVVRIACYNWEAWRTMEPMAHTDRWNLGFLPIHDHLEWWILRTEFIGRVQLWHVLLQAEDNECSLKAATQCSQWRRKMILFWQVKGKSLSFYAGKVLWSFLHKSLSAAVPFMKNMKLVMWS